MNTILFHIDGNALIQHAENAEVFVGEEGKWEGTSLDSLLSRPFGTISFEKVLEEMKKGLTKYKTVIWEMVKRSGQVAVTQLSVSSVDADTYLVVVDEYKSDEFNVTLGADGSVKSCGSQSIDFFGYPAKDIEREGLFLLFGLSKSEIDALLATENRRNLTGRHASGSDFYCNVSVNKKKFGSVSMVLLKIVKLNPELEVAFILNEQGTIESFSENIFQVVFGFGLDMNGKNLNTALTIEEDELSDKSSEEKSSDDGLRRSQDRAKRRKVSTFVNAPESFEWRDDGEHIIKYYSGSFRHEDGSDLPVLIEFYSFRRQEKKSAVRIKRTLMKSSRYYGKWELSEKLGSGMGGKVFSAKHRESGKPAAIKVIKKRTLEEEEVYGRVKKESEIMVQLVHPNIVRFYEVLETKTQLLIVMELVEGATDLLNFTKRKGDFSESAARTIFKQILGAVTYCHSKQIYHRDIKHDNILVNDEDCVKLIDFGLSRVLEKGTLGTTFCGTPQYSAPEMILGQKYQGSHIDVWSLGVVFYTLVSGGTFPFDSISQILTSNDPTYPDISPECLDLLKKMLERDSSKRISLEDISLHPWLDEGEETPKADERDKQE